MIKKRELPSVETNAMNYREKVIYSCEPVGLNEAFKAGAKWGLEFAIKEVQEWRKLKILAFNSSEFVDRADAKRETRNTLNLLGTIESALRGTLGETDEDVFKSMVERAKEEILR